jgi:vacuolar-type H+-ATPase subunit H
MATETEGAAMSGSVEALRRVKAVEAEWEARLNTARQLNEAELRQLREEAEAAVKAAQVEAETERAAQLERARAETAGAAATIVAQGRKAAEQAAQGEGRRPADKKDAILDAVLGSFGKD